ncbi:SusC/RagA family TonB-linked outer membrane protein [Pseudalgibacter alginicilyticus]|nr:SusC/RagA family TonB-linked outer membrane protein [Pseudalgibacter alginicilyticus]
MSKIKIHTILKKVILCFVFLFYASQLVAQSMEEEDRTFELSGTVIDAEGNPLEGVMVTLQEKTELTKTNSNGLFKINVLQDDVVIYSLPGYEIAQKIVESDTENLDVSLQKLLIGETLANVAFGTYNERELSGAFSSTKAHDIRKNAVNTIEQALNGTVAGLHSIKNGSQKFGVSNYNFYLRGLATNGSATPLILVDGIDANINLLDPKEVESITVLKDASELAMYGIRGANGVILIKTKQGSEVSSYMNLELKSGFQTPSYIAPKLNAYQYTTLYNEASTNDGRASVFNTGNYLNPTDVYRYPDSDFPDLFLRNDTESAYQNYTFTTGGGNSKARYFFLVGYMKQGGIFSVPVDFSSVNQTYNERYNFRSNIDVDLGKGFELNTKIVALNDQKRSPNAGGTVNNANNSLFASIMSTPANAYPVLNSDGSYGGDAEYQQNIMGILQSGFRNEATKQLTVKAEITKDLGTLLKGLSLNAVYSFENYNSYYNGESTQFAVYELNPDDTYTQYGTQDTKASSFGGQMTDFYNDATFMAGFNYDNTFGDHELKGSVITHQYTSRVSGDNPDYRWFGTSSRLLYGFKNKYYAQVSGAYQGSNGFASGNRYGFFPSAGASWIISEEDFLKNSEVVNYLKLRASYGLTGNDRSTPRFLYRQAFTRANGYGFGNPNGSVDGTTEGTLANPNATWETAYKTNIGLDLNVLNQALAVTVNYFHEKRTDILVPQSNVVPDLIGVDLPVYNAGEITNAGFDAQLDYNKTFGEFKFNVGANMSYAKSNVVDLKETAYRDEEQYRYLKGNPVDSQFGLVATGIYNSQSEIDADGVVSSYGTLKPGDIRYEDLNGDGIINTADRKAIGNYLPEIIYGLHLGIEYNGFDLYGFAEGATQYNIMVRPDEFSSYAYENRWTTTTGTAQSVFPRVSLESEHNSQTSTFWQEEGKLFRLATVEMGYTFPKQVANSLSISNMRLYVNLDNVFSTTTDRENRDYEATSAGYTQYPLMKTFLLGLSVNL